MRKVLGWMAFLVVVAAAPVAAQESNDEFVQGVLQAIRLPTVTREARTLGVPDRDVRGILTTARERRIRAGSVAELFAAENDAIRQHGPIDNFGAFVQQKLDAGLRGRELAAAIQAEHGARGKGKGYKGEAGKSGEQGKRGSPGKSGDYGKPDSPGKSGDHGKPASPGKPDDKGKPDSPGQSEDKGKKGGSQ